MTLGGMAAVATVAVAAAAIFAVAGLADGSEVVTNQFHVVVKRDAQHEDTRQLADEIATKSGFHNLGPVSNPINMSQADNIQFSTDLS